MKVIRDLTADIPKNLMLALAIGIGVFGVGSILGAYQVLMREMRTNYMGTNPASATIEFGGKVSNELLDSIQHFPGIKVAERRATVTGGSALPSPLASRNISTSPGSRLVT